MIAKALRSTAGNSSGGQIHLAHECAKTGIVDYPLKKLLILAATLRFAGKKEIVQSDGGSAEGIGLDDIRAGLQILDVNLLDDLRLCKQEQFETAFEIFALPVAKPFSSIIRL